jgi:type I restriction enzyme, S subunit
VRWPRYERMKASGVAWLGEVPGHWTVKPLGRVADVRLSNVDKKSVDGQPAVRLCNYVDVYYNDRINSDGTFMEATASEDQVKRFSLQRGDVLLTKDSETPDDIASPAVVSEDLDDVVCGYHLALLRPSSNMDGRFLSRAISASPVCDHFFSSATGVTRFGLSRRDIATAPIPTPPLDEQRTIAAFLDRETARIDALVAAKRRLIALLQEKRAALIARAVTRGLVSEAPTKDSGVAWLGRVPVHWDVKRFRFVASVCEGQVDPEDDEISQMMLVAPNHVESGTGRLVLEETAEDQGAISGKYPVRQGEVVYSKIRPALNKVWVADRDCMCSADMYPILCGAAILPAYLAAYMRSPGFLKLMVDESLRVAMPKVNRETLADAPIAVPSVDEQAEIVSEINRAAAKIDAALNLASETVARLTEYRSTLITSAVTGRIDVRAAA